jgi:beta-fructofuranosidase
VLHLPSSWTWDFWLADDGQNYHLFFLKASRALGDPGRRHWRATVGHAVSGDLRSWTEVADALLPADPPAWDDLATWTGCVVRGDDRRWRMFYTGVDRASGGLIRRIGVVVSDDLYAWHRVGEEPLLEADPRWYEKRADGSWPDEAWRDPWVLPDPDGEGWHMLVTARSRHGAPDQRGVVGHARSTDLSNWTSEPPLSEPGQGFGQLEVTQVEVIGGRPVLLFSCLGTELSRARQDAGETGGVWVADADSATGPFDIAGAYRLTNESHYAGRLVRDRQGMWQLLAFRHTGPDGRFVGQLAEPVTIGRDEAGRLRVAAEAPSNRDQPEPNVAAGRLR